MNPASDQEAVSSPVGERSAKAEFHLRLLGVFTSSKDIVGTLKDIVGIAALLVAGVWTYALTKQFRDAVPRLSIKHEVASWVLHDRSVLVRVDVTLLNSGKVLIKGLNGDIIVERLLPETEQQQSEYAEGKILFDCTGKDGRLFKGCISEQGLNLPAESKKDLPIEASDRTLEPGESESYWRYLVFDRAVRVVEVSTFIENPEAGRDRGWQLDSTHTLSPVLTEESRPKK
jgi:hypothetical protein